MATASFLVADFLRNPSGNSPDMNVDGSSTPIVFEWRNTQQFPTVITQANILIEASGPSNLGNYGNLPALSNGVEIRIVNTAAVVLKVLALVKRNADYALVTRQSPAFLPSTGSNFFAAAWSPGAGEGISLLPGDAFQIVIQDDLSGLTTHTGTVQGSMPKPPVIGSANR